MCVVQKVCSDETEGSLMVLFVLLVCSQNGVQWLDLQAPLTEERYELCKQCKGPFTGDPSNKFFVIPEPPQPSEFDESNDLFPPPSPPSFSPKTICI